MSINIPLIKESFEAVKPHANDFVNHFYEVLFNRYPQSKELFKKVNMEQQKKALIASLSHIVEFIEDGEHLTDYLQKMGTRHLKHGTTDEHFAWVGESLIATFEYFFDEQWTNELKNSWIEAYGIISEEMKKGMKKDKHQVHEMKFKQELGLEQMASEIAMELFKKAVENFSNSPEFQKAVHDKAQEMLKTALNAHASTYLDHIRDNRKVA